jgi:hypothetical protein
MKRCDFLELETICFKDQADFAALKELSLTASFNRDICKYKPRGLVVSKRVLDIFRRNEGFSSIGSLNVFKLRIRIEQRVPGHKRAIL